jgi:GGDEF-like domain
VDSHIGAVAARLNERATEISAAICTALEDNIAELPDDDRTIELLHVAVRDHIRTVMYALLHDTPVEQITAPAASLEFARHLAQRNVPVNEMMRAHRLGQRRITELVFAELHAFGLESTTRVAVIEAITTTLLKYVDSIELQALAVYQGERKLLLENRSTARETHVRSMLEDDTLADVDAASAAIGYPLSWRHLALIVWYPDGEAVGDEFARVQQFIGDLAKTVDTWANALLAADEPNSAWAWLPYRSPPGDVVTKIRDFVRARPDAPNIAIGAMGSGVKGFRRSHRQARRAQTAGLARSRRKRVLVAATDPGIMPTALLAGGVEEIRDWVADVLGPLASDTDDDACLRNTLQEFLRFGLGYQPAAEEPNSDPSSVKSGVERAVARRGRPIDDRVDVELALHACRWYGAAVLQPG